MKETVLKIKSFLDYWYGKGVGEKILELGNYKIEIAKTGKIRRLYINEKLAFTFRPRDFYPVPTEFGAVLLHKVIPFMKRRAVIDDEQIKFAKEKKSILNKFIIDLDESLYAGDYVLVVDKHDELIAVGQLILSPKEIKDLNTGFGIKVKRVIEEFDKLI